MSKTPRTATWRVASLAVLAATWLVLCVSGPARAETLFSEPLHLTRVLEDPITGASEFVEEYYFGNRAVAVRGPLTAISDYEKNELTRIDREAGTFSVSPFAELARPQARTKAGGEWKIESQAPREISGRSAEVLHATRSGVTLAIGLDLALRLPAPAIDVILGSAWPNSRTPAGEVLAQNRAARGATKSSPEGSAVPLPLEQVVTYQVSGDTVQARNVVVRVGRELAPSELVAIPAGARRVDSRAVQFDSILRELDSPGVTP